MPLQKGRSRAAVSGNIEKIVQEYKQSGKIGTSSPKTKQAAVKQAVAIALHKAGKGRKT